MADLDPGKLDPLVRKLSLKVEAPSLDDTASDWERLQRALRPRFPDRPLRINLDAMLELGPALRRGDWQATVTLAEVEDEPWVIRVGPGEVGGHCLGLAVDVGTTTVSMELVDLDTGDTVDTRLAYNGQRLFGADVTSRLMHAEKPGGLTELHETVLATLNELIDELTGAAGMAREDIWAVACAGNTIMAHLLLGLDPTAIRREPYVPVTTVFPTVRTQDVGLALAEEAVLYTLPAISGYVGGDITAGLLATGIADEEPVSILIDIGTNGETVLGNREWLIACSGSAGSAFEGCGLEWGMNATAGAIERVWVKSRGIQCRTVGEEQPRGICGSGLIEALGSLLAAGIIDRAGKINPQSFGVRRGEYHPEIVLAPAPETAVGRDITLRQPDIENLIRDKAALYAGSRILLANVGLSFDEVERVLIAGNFGRSLDIEQAVRIGLLPDIPRQKIQFIGNSSLAGAHLALLSGTARRRALEVVSGVTTLELTVEPRYFDEYTAALFLPHTNLSLFPSVAVQAGG
jgi:uncharacterized 2Fe-2S/4Fe-4S cluster protein (DUF4445 family)